MLQKFVLFILFMALTVMPAMAIDQSYCNEQWHPWATDWFGEGTGSCLGVLTADEIPAFLAEYPNQMHLGVTPPVEDLQIENKPFALRWVTPRNHMMPADEVRQLYWGKEGKSHGLMFSGELNVQTIPQIWKYTSSMGDYYIIDSRLPAACEELCGENGCPFEAQNMTLEDGTVCGWQCEPDGNGGETCPDMYGGVIRISSGGEPMTKHNITKVTWHNGPNGPESLSAPALWDSPHENLNYMRWDTGLNILTTWRGMYQDNINCYSRVFSDHMQPGPNTWTIEANNGGSKTFTIDIPGPIRVLPVVPAKITQQQYETRTLGKSGKIIGTLTEVEVDNIKAREITDEDGETRLLIQWAEPDAAMKFSEYQTDVRLRIYVGDMGKEDSVHFLWMDIPVTSGSCVVPAPEWQELKQILSAKGDTEVFISGQYREHFNNLANDGYTNFGYHNRGYFGIIKFPIN